MKTVSPPGTPLRIPAPESGWGTQAGYKKPSPGHAGGWLRLSKNSVFRQKREKVRAFAKAHKVCLAESEFPQGIGISSFGISVTERNAKSKIAFRRWRKGRWDFFDRLKHSGNAGGCFAFTCETAETLLSVYRCGSAPVQTRRYCRIRR